MGASGLFDGVRAQRPARIRDNALAPRREFEKKKSHFPSPLA